MFRWLQSDLVAWLRQRDRRPLVLRGARQVGKTWLVRHLAEHTGRTLVELNLERDPRLHAAFGSNDPQAILGELSLVLDRAIDPTTSLLFIDEIQAAGELLAKLRWFYEELPSLPLVAAGSLLEFALADHAWSMPVGRVTFRHLEPMGFAEFLCAHGQHTLLEQLSLWRAGQVLSAAVHDAGSRWFWRYSMVGGMPAVVAADAAGEPPSVCRAMQRDLVATYRADFAKYNGRMDPLLLDQVLRAVAASLGRKFVYARAGDGIKAFQAKRGLQRLAQAQVCHVVRWAAGTGLPLGAVVKDRVRKALLADVGLLHALVGTPADRVFPTRASLSPGLRGQLIEQLAGQALRLVVGEGHPPELFYWQRDGGRPGEIDYLIQLHGRIVPVELKSGSAGSMKSLHQFMHDKRFSWAVRCDANPPSLMTVDVRTTTSQRVSYNLLSVPHYLMWNLRDVLAEVLP